MAKKRVTTFTSKAPKTAAQKLRKKKLVLNDEQRKQLAAAAGGITPLEFACSVLRDPDAPMGDKRWAVELLMPYMHQKLPTSVSVNPLGTGGAVMLLPMIGDSLAWEKSAEESQEKLKKQVRH